MGEGMGMGMDGDGVGVFGRDGMVSVGSFCVCK